ncbi:hypothetical protein [Deinococcus sp.]|uniref:hypothetical protein n=1 Tax=Deinococcus sp. TaxID=47478 RepID=UPI002869C225|nr:hypothetical protein [Deinococcus sp.]
MSLDADIRAVIASVQGDAELNEVRFKHRLTFTLGAHTWVARCGVRDPSKAKPDELARLQATATEQGVSYRDLRLVRVHPEDTIPFPGSTVAWDNRTLQILHWSQPSDFTGQRVGTCVLRSP